VARNHADFAKAFHTFYGNCISKFLNNSGAWSVAFGSATFLPRCISAFDSRLRSFLPHSACVHDQIHIEKLEVFVLIGVPDEERSQAQRLTFSITLWPRRDARNLEDQIEKAVNYAAVCEETKKFVSARGDKLIETLADAVGTHLLEVFEIRRITVELRKYILPEAEFVSVTVTRERAKE
jgi:FolB domain-containing protein